MTPHVISNPTTKENEEQVDDEIFDLPSALHPSSLRKTSSLCTFTEEEEYDEDDDNADDMWFSSSDNANTNYNESCVSLSLHDLHQDKEQRQRRQQQLDDEDDEANHNSSSTRLRRRSSLEHDCIQTKMILAEQKTNMDSLQHQLNESQNENKLLTNVISYLRTKVDAAQADKEKAEEKMKKEHVETTQSSNSIVNDNEELYELRRQLLQTQHLNAKLTRQLQTTTKDCTTYQTQVTHLSQRCDALSEEFHLSLDVVFQLRDRVERLTAERDDLRGRLNMDVKKEDSVALPWIGGWFSNVNSENKGDLYLKKDGKVMSDASNYVSANKMDGINEGMKQDEQGRPQGYTPSPASSTAELDSITSKNDIVKASSSSTSMPRSFSLIDTRNLFQFRRNNIDSSATASGDDCTSAAAVAASSSFGNTSPAVTSTRNGRKPKANSDAGLFGGLFKRAAAKTEEKYAPSSNSSSADTKLQDTSSSKSDGSNTTRAALLLSSASSSFTKRSFRSRSFDGETLQQEDEDGNIWSRDSGKNMTWNSNRRFGDDSDEDPIRRRSVFHTELANNSLPPSSILNDSKSKTCIARPA